MQRKLKYPSSTSPEIAVARMSPTSACKASGVEQAGIKPGDQLDVIVDPKKITLRLRKPENGLRGVTGGECVQETDSRKTSSGTN